MFNNLPLILKNNLINILFFLYIFFYICGPALINIYLTLLSLTCLWLIFKNYKLIKIGLNDKSTIIFLLFFIYTFLISIFKGNFNIDIVSFLRILIIYFFLVIFFNNKKFELNLREIFLFFVTILSLDALYQFIFRENIIGFQIYESYRLTSFFQDEPIIGSFLLKLTVPLLGFYIYQKQKINFMIFILILSSSLIFLSGERMPLLQYLFAILLLIIFSNNKKNAFVIFITIFSFILILFTFNQNLQERYKTTVTTFSSIIYQTTQNDSYIKNPSVNEYILNFKSGFQLWSNNKFFGGGYRYYNQNCQIILSDINPSGCSTHPHNIYIEILSDYGLFGLFIFSFFLFNIFIDYYKKFNSSPFLGLGILFFVIVFPLTTSQSIFSSYYGSLFFLFIFIMKYLNISKTQ